MLPYCPIDPAIYSTHNSVDTTQGGDGVLEISVKRGGAKVPVRLERLNNDGKYNVEFEPSGAGLYLIDVTFSGMVVRG